MAIIPSPSTAMDVPRDTEVDGPQQMSTLLEKKSETENQPECLLHGAAFITITHFDKNIVTLELEKEYFEEAEHSIVEFSQLVTVENDKNDTTLTQMMVNHLFTGQVLDLYDFGHPMTEKVLGQLDCPLMKRFWEMRTSPETFHLRNSNDTHNEFRWSQSVPTKAQRAMDAGMVVVENRDSKVKVPLIGLISSLEDLDIQGLRHLIKRANKGIRMTTVFAVLEGVLNHLYRDPLQDLREKRRMEIEAVIAAARKSHRPQATKIPIASQEAGRQASSSKSSNPRTPAIATKDQPSDYAQSTTANKRQRL